MLANEAKTNFINHLQLLIEQVKTDTLSEDKYQALCEMYLTHQIIDLAANSSNTQDTDDSQDEHIIKTDIPKNSHDTPAPSKPLNSRYQPDFDNVEMMRFFILGWYIYTCILKTNRNMYYNNIDKSEGDMNGNREDDQDQCDIDFSTL